MGTFTQSDSETIDPSVSTAIEEFYNRLRKVTPEFLVDAVRKDGVVGQDAFVDWFAKQLCMQLARIVAYHNGFDQDRLPRMSCLFVLGSTATGKTFIVKRFFKALNIKMQTVDTSSLTGAGWHGGDVNSELKDLAETQKECPGTVCAVFWDEADKMKRDSVDNHESFNPQANILKVLDGGIYEGRTRDASGKDVLFSVDTNLVIQVFAGAFTGLDKVVARRIQANSHSYGLAAQSENNVRGMSAEELRAQAKPIDIIEYGIMSELVGRISSLYCIPSLTRDDFRNIVKGSASSLEATFQNLLPSGVALSFSDDAVNLLADQALESGLGARSLEQNATSCMAETVSSCASNAGITGVAIEVKDGTLIPVYSYGSPASNTPRNTNLEQMVDHVITETSKLENVAIPDDDKLCKAFPLSFTRKFALHGGAERLSELAFPLKGPDVDSIYAIAQARDLLASLVLFICEVGADHERNVSTLALLLGTQKNAQEKLYLENIMRQFERAETYDTTTHSWVKNPRAIPKPRDPAVLRFKKVSALSDASFKKAHKTCRSWLSSLYFDKEGTAQLIGTLQEEFPDCMN